MTHTKRFGGYAALVTGAARGIGTAAARRLAEEGARVVLTDRDGQMVENTAARLREQNLTARALECDVADRTAVEAPRRPRSSRTTSDDEWARDLDVTLGGSYRCSCAALPHLVASGRGAIVNIGSVNGLQDFGNHANSAAKAGLGSLTRTLAGHAAARGVRVNLVVPGTVRTSAWQGREAELTEMQRLWSSTEASPRSTPAPHGGPSGPGASS